MASATAGEEADHAGDMLDLLSLVLFGRLVPVVCAIPMTEAVHPAAGRA